MQVSGNANGASTADQAIGLLRKDIQHDDLNQEKRDLILSDLRLLGRTPGNVTTIYQADGIDVLGHFAFGRYERSTAKGALRCIANALLLVPETQKKFAALGLHTKAADDLQLEDNDDELLLSRILFLMTYSGVIDLRDLIDNHNLASNIRKQLHRHAEDAVEDQAGTTAMAETLKLLFNVCDATPDRMDVFSPTIPELLKLLNKTSIPLPALQPPLTYVLNALANIEITQTGDVKAIIEAMTPQLESAAFKLISILDAATKSYKPSELDIQGIPLLTILRKVNDGAPQEIRAMMRSRLLPDDSERDRPLGQSSTLASRLLRLTTAPGLANIPGAVSSLLFELSDRNAESFIKNVGYGYAAGFLMSHKIPIPDRAKQPDLKQGQDAVNPVTGQRLDKEVEIDAPEMTEEEKEREAERLFVLFERLKATGIVDVENPVRKAMEEGRFEEVKETDEDKD